jgi:hypothetical protein
LFHAHLVKWGISLDARVANEKIDGTEFVNRPTKQVADFFLFSYVGFHGEAIAAVASNYCDHFFGLCVLTKAVYDDLRTGFGKRNRHSSSNPRIDPGYDGFLSDQEPWSDVFRRLFRNCGLRIP